jgi:hypothetical protein
MRPHLLLLVCIMLGSGICKAQDYAITTPPPKAPSTKKDPRPMKDRLWFGGGVSLMFGTVTNLGVAPMVGYKIDQKGKWSAGLGLNYFYFKDTRYVVPYESSNYGWSLFQRYRVIPQAFLHASFNSQNYEIYNPFGDRFQREWVPFLMVGGGYAQQLGGNSYMLFQIAWDVIQDVRSPYGAQPFFSVGAGVGF